jgi:hypothetical protein
MPRISKSTSKGKAWISISLQMINSLIITKFLSQNLNQQPIACMTSKSADPNILLGIIYHDFYQNFSNVNLKIPGWSIIHTSNYCGLLCEFIALPKSHIINLIKDVRGNNMVYKIIIIPQTSISLFLYIVPWSSHYPYINIIILESHKIRSQISIQFNNATHHASAALL